MKKSTKGVLAASAAGALLLGGAGSLAYWNANTTISGEGIASGQLGLGPANCSGWTLDSAENNGASYDGSAKLVPGDKLTNVCTYAITAEGAHLRANVVASQGAVTGGLASAFSVAATDVEVNGGAVTSITSADDGQNMTVTIVATFDNPNAVDNTTQNLTGQLSDVTVNLNQVHS